MKIILFATCIILIFNKAKGSLEAEGIIGGRNVDGPNEFPYLVSFQNATEHWCGGAIIGDQFILTAAHCVIKEDVKFRDFPHIIIAGIDSLDSDQDTKVEVDVEKIYVSERYNHSWWFLGDDDDVPADDWAVLKLKTKLDINNNKGLAIVNLPEKIPGTNEYDTYENATALLAGYGYDYVEIIKYQNGTERDRGNSTGELHKANVRVLSNKVCSDPKDGYDSPVLDTQICARIIEHTDLTPQGPCNGDSGSPLVIGNTVIGIMCVSVLACNDNRVPALYTRVTSHVDVIRNAMKDVTKGLRVATAP